MEKLFEIKVRTGAPAAVKGASAEVCLLPFTGEATGKYFSGNIVGTGVDTQKTVCGKTFLSARYMLEGTDIDGSFCRIFIENNGDFESGFSPSLITDSKALSKFETSKLKAEISPFDGGVLVSIFAP